MANQPFPVATTLFPSSSSSPPSHCLPGSPLVILDAERSDRDRREAASGKMMPANTTTAATSSSTAAAVSLRRVLHSIGTRTASLASLAEVMQSLGEKENQCTGVRVRYIYVCVCGWVYVCWWSLNLAAGAAFPLGSVFRQIACARLQCLLVTGYLSSTLA